MLINDMGGHGRALESLEIAIRGKDLDNCNFADLMDSICLSLTDCYSEWVNQTTYLKPVLHLILTHNMFGLKNFHS